MKNRVNVSFHVDASMLGELHFAIVQLIDLADLEYIGPRKAELHKTLCDIESAIVEIENAMPEPCIF